MGKKMKMLESYRPAYLKTKLYMKKGVSATVDFLCEYFTWMCQAFRNPAGNYVFNIFKTFQVNLSSLHAFMNIIE